MAEYNDKWTIDRVYFYTRGYYDGRAKGVSNTEDVPDEYLYYYRRGYEIGVIDYSTIDEPENV